MAQEPTSKGEKRPFCVGKYQVIKHIATGGMGAVYKALDPELNRTVALKILAPKFAAKPAMLERFKREGKSAARLRHENIVAIYEIGESNGQHFLALEFVDGMDLQEHIVRRGKLDVQESRLILIQAVKALDHAHRAHIVHRDIKPSNFLITKNEAGQLLVKLTDLGLARMVNDDDFRVTRADTTIGTVDYMSPEQAQNSGSADIRSDIYSLGCTYYQMLAGKCPFPKGSLVDRIMKHRDAEPADIRTLNSAVPSSVVNILRKMMAKKPEQRYQTPQELLGELEDPANFLPSLDENLPVTTPAAALFEKQPQAEEKPRRAKPVTLKKKRYRDKGTEELPPGKPKKSPWPTWWPWAAGGGAVFLVAVVLLSLAGSGQRKPREVVQTTTEPPPIPPTDATQDGDKKPPPPKEAVVVKMGPEEPALPRLYKPAQPLSRAALRQEFVGPFQEVATPPAEAKVATVRRLPGPGEYRSVGEALAKTDGPIILEIHDKGPIFEASLPVLRGRSLWIRAGPGFRPLVAWDVAAGKDKSPPPFLALSGGSLTLEDVDVVVKGPAGRGEEADCMFALQDGSFAARNCTFSVAGKRPRGLVLVRMERSATQGATGQLDPDQDNASPAQVRFTRCYIRGSDLIVLDAKGTALETLIEGSLLVCGDNPMIRITGNTKDSIALRLVRSTLVAGQNFVHWKSLAGKPCSPRIQVLCWDALVARADANAAQGDMFYLGDGANLINVSWRPVNSLYAGWKRLLYSADKSIGTGSFETWRAALSIREGDQELPETWPPQVPAEPETLAAQVFTPFETPVVFAASGGPGPLGCELGRLPPEPLSWLQRTFDRYLMPVVPLPEGGSPPPIPNPGDGFYHGERLDLTKIDLGKHLQARLQAARPGPRIVLHLAGKGKQLTSVLKVKGIPNLVLFFESLPDKEEPLTLLVNPQSVQDRGALIEVADGNLELIQARFLLENKRAGAVPAHLIRMRGGDLILNRCQLQGPLDKAPEAYSGLIRFDGADDDGQPLPALLFQDTVLLSSRSLLDLTGGARLRVRNCAALAVEDGFIFTPGARSRPNVFVQFEHNTLAFRQTLVSVRSEGLITGSSEGIMIQAQQNYFLNPFADEPAQARLLRVPGLALAKGIVQWQGKGNAFDQLRLHGYVGVPTDKPAKQSFKEWQQLWGTPGEQDAALLEPAKLKVFILEPTSWAHLGLPPQVRAGPGPPPFGADLVRLGIMKRKG